MSFSPITNLVQTFRFLFFFLVKCLYEGKTSNCQKQKKHLIIKQEMGLFVFLNLLCVVEDKSRSPRPKNNLQQLNSI